MKRLIIVLAAACLAVVGWGAGGRPPEARQRIGAAEAEGEREATDTEAWKVISAELAKKGELKDGVYRVVVPRLDLEVTVEGNVVPASAGIESEFRFYRCPCGRINVVGQFVVADYEANDVIDSLRQGKIEVASVKGIPPSFDLMVPGHHKQHCRVAWRAMREMGIAFAQPFN